MAILDYVVVPHILDWIYSKGFDEYDEFPFDGVAMLEQMWRYIQEQWESGHYVISR